MLPVHCYAPHSAGMDKNMDIEIFFLNRYLHAGVVGFAAFLTRRQGENKSGKSYAFAVQ